MPATLLPIIIFNSLKVQKIQWWRLQGSITHLNTSDNHLMVFEIINQAVESPAYFLSDAVARAKETYLCAYL